MNGYFKLSKGMVGTVWNLKYKAFNKHQNKDNKKFKLSA